MGIMDGLKAAQKLQNEAAAGGGDYVKVDWLKINDGQTVRLQFLQELDSDSPFYSEEAGTAIFAVEHTPQQPFDFKRKFLCTMEDEGQCWGCEMAQENNKWKAKPRFYANVVVESNGDRKVFVMSQGLSDKSVTPNVISYAEEAKGITKATWKVSRTGASQTSTSYTAVPFPSDAASLAGLELFDLRAGAVRDIAYASQQAYVSGGTAAATPEEPSTSSAPVRDDIPDW